MKYARQAILWSGFLLLLLGGFLGYKALNPNLTPDQRILRNLEATKIGIERRNVGGSLKYLADDFTWQGTPKKEIADYMRGAYFGWRDVQLNLSAVQVNVQGERATTTGNYRLSYRPSADAPVETRVGNFRLFWEVGENNEWKVQRAEGEVDIR